MDLIWRPQFSGKTTVFSRLLKQFSDYSDRSARAALCSSIFVDGFQNWLLNPSVTLKNYVQSFLPLLGREKAAVSGLSTARRLTRRVLLERVCLRLHRWTVKLLVEKQGPRRKTLFTVRTLSILKLNYRDSR